MSPVVVRVEPRLRLAGCLLAASDWPEREQDLKPYRPHRLAEGARRALLAQQTHAAVAAIQGLEPARLFARAWADDWPGDLATQVADFAGSADVERFCVESQAEWQMAQADLEAVLARTDLAGFLGGLFSNLAEDFLIYPNLLYPGRQAVSVRVAGQIVLSQPPPVAWGASPPWRYGERPDEVLGAVAEGLARPLFERALEDRPAQAGAFALAAAVLFLRRAEGAPTADQFMLMEQRARKLPQLPELVEALDRGKIFDREERQGG